MKTLNMLLTIDPSKECLVFLRRRVLADNYRGLQISQHNRYTYEQVIGMLEIFYDLVKENRMKIRTTDISKRPYNTLDEFTYANYTSQVCNKFGKGTQDSIRKNLFVDFHRMGLINRFSPSGECLDPYEARTVSEVSLTKLSLNLIDKSLNILEKYLLFTRALDNLLLGLATDFLVILSELDYLTIHEYTFFVSFLRQNLNGDYISLEQVIDMVKEYRKLSKFQKEAVSATIQSYCNPNNFKGNKTNKRDYHNWINETQQVFMILNMTAYYYYNSSSQRIEFMVDPNCVFTSKDDIKRIKRSIHEKKDYFKYHNIDKIVGFELHHIVPLLWARNSTEFFLLDKWENMIYLDGGKHSTISQSGNKHVKLCFDENGHDVSLKDSLDNVILLKDEIHTAYNPELKRMMLEKNKDLLSSF